LGRQTVGSKEVVQAVGYYSLITRAIRLAESPFDKTPGEEYFRTAEQQ